MKYLTLPSWVMQSMGKDFRGLICAVKIGVVSGYRVGWTTTICVHIHSKDRSCEITMAEKHSIEHI